MSQQEGLAVGKVARDVVVV